MVAVIDTGIDHTHPDLAANIWLAPSSFTVTINEVPITCPAGSHGFNAITLTCDPMDDHHHGTHVAGTIGASGNNGVGIVGVNWTAQIMGIKFLDAGGSGTVADATNAIEFAIQAKQAFAATGRANIRVLSNRRKGPEFSQALPDEINAANGHDMLFVAGAGNDGLPNDFLPTYPASFGAPNIVAVAATDNTDTLAWFSNWGTSTVHLAAPGVDVLSTVPGNSYAFLSGTSMATPHVSGAAALVLSRCALDTADLKETLLSTVEPVAGLVWATITGGRLDVNSALHSCIAPPATPTNLTAVAGDHKVTLTWPAVQGAMRYSVKRAGTAGGPYVVIASDIKAKSYVDSAVVNDTPYYYVLSASNSAGESGDSNEVTATPRVPPDLVISSLTVPAVGAAGATIVISETIRNQGTGAAGSSTTRLYLSNSSSFDANDVMLDGVHDVPALQAGATSLALLDTSGVLLAGSRLVSGLVSGAGRSGMTTLTIPSGVAPASYYVIAKADAGNAVIETLENNNILSRAMQVGGDLIVSALTVPSKAAAGSAIVVNDTTTNQDGGAVSASTTRFYLSMNPLFDTGDTLLEDCRIVSELDAGAASSGSTTLTLPATLTPGTYYVIAKADADGTVAERVETNNTLARAFQVTVGP